MGIIAAQETVLWGDVELMRVEAEDERTGKRMTVKSVCSSCVWS